MSALAGECEGAELRGVSRGLQLISRPREMAGVEGLPVELGPIQALPLPRPFPAQILPPWL